LAPQAASGPTAARISAIAARVAPSGSPALPKKPVKPWRTAATVIRAVAMPWAISPTT
jgi:hypothetical protein